jgi:hypothetical protein
MEFWSVVVGTVNTKEQLGQVQIGGFFAGDWKELGEGFKALTGAGTDMTYRTDRTYMTYMTYGTRLL